MEDGNGRGASTHTAYNDYEIFAANLDDDPRRVGDRISADALHIDPPFGPAGMSEAEARHRGCRVLVARRSMSQVARAIEKEGPGAS